MQKPLKPEQRVGLLTLPLNDNYGGMLQIVALYNVLQREGWEPVLFRSAPRRSLLQRALAALLRSIPAQNVRGLREREMNRRTHAPFLKRYLPETTALLRSSARLSQEVERRRLAAFVVGSDQVWRPDYARYGGNPLTYFLDFVGDEVAKISYAASFGRSQWRDHELTDQVSDLLARFEQVTVREETGERICDETFGREDAQLVLDPTLLMPAEFYQGMMPAAPSEVAPRVTKYVLDTTPVLEDLETQALARLGPQAVTREILLGKAGHRVTVGEWLRAFHDADFIITDSFHGMAFSILFQKQFAVLINNGRGADRFHSLASQLGLEDRLIPSQGPAHLPKEPIDYGSVNTRLDTSRAASMALLRQGLAHSSPH
ncbi:MAG: polysaccharide pyruvyl transferase family protein [Rhodobacteraceae bacterium]|nr:MAG: polysaccharide pyruvyl transferase family protein [Paracoccaceae bacterium]